MIGYKISLGLGMTSGPCLGDKDNRYHVHPPPPPTDGTERCQHVDTESRPCPRTDTQTTAESITQDG